MVAVSSPGHVVALAMPDDVGHMLASVRPKKAELIDPMIWPWAHVTGVEDVEIHTGPTVSTTKQRDIVVSEHHDACGLHDALLPCERPTRSMRQMMAMYI